MSLADWKRIAKNQPTAKLMHTIMTACNKPEEFVADPAIVNLVGPANRPALILDVGCGLGRNAAGFLKRSKRWSVVGYDTPEMIERASEHLAEVLTPVEQRRIVLECFPARVCELGPYDVAVAVYAFQHFGDEELRACLDWLATCTARLVVSGRRWMDNGRQDTFAEIAKSKWMIDKPNGYRPIGGREDHFTVEYRLR